MDCSAGGTYICGDTNVTFIHDHFDFTGLTLTNNNGDALGFTYMDTPNLDRLVSEGITFTQCHIAAPSCAPSRASLFTGYYPHTTGILKNADLPPIS